MAVGHHRPGEVRQFRVDPADGEDRPQEDVQGVAEEEEGRATVAQKEELIGGDGT